MVISGINAKTLRGKDAKKSEFQSQITQMKAKSSKLADGDLVFFPFKVYVVLAPVGLWIWREATAGERLRGALTEATGRIAFGYLLCTMVFLLAAAARFLIKRQNRVAENLMWGGISFIVALCVL